MKWTTPYYRRTNDSFSFRQGRTGFLRSLHCITSTTICLGSVLPSLPQTFLCSFQQQFANFVFLLRVFLLKLSYGILSQCQSAPLVTRLSLTRFEASGTANNGEKELSESNSRTISTLMLLSCIQNVSTTYCFSDFHSFPTFPPLILRGCHINHAIVSHLRMFTREVFDFNLALEEETEESSAVASLSFPHLQCKTVKRLWLQRRIK